MVLEMAREEIFKDILVELPEYDYQILDCAPSATLLTVNAIAYVEEVFIPVSMEMLALAGARQFMTYLRTVSRMLGSGGVIRLIIPTMYDPRRRVSAKVLQGLKKDFGDRVTRPIRVDTQLSEAPGVGQTIFEYAPRSRGAKDYAILAKLVDEMPSINLNHAAAQVDSVQ
jgi:chromosome partitioning protein